LSLLTLQEASEAFIRLAEIARKADPYFHQKYLLLRGSSEEIQKYLETEG
jgi:hypothetical protein